ncbi:MAG: ExeM/NucH family extracellular endonuclease [Rhodobacter sp.]|nr:ExeM/NucH family extracellular endonuclease [Rhodobacter sp.]
MSFLWPNFIFGTSSSDVLNGTNTNDWIFGFFGDDYLSGLGGDDRLFGGFGNDTIRGGEGDDRINGGLGFDVAVYSGRVQDYSITQIGRGPWQHTLVASTGAVDDPGTDRLRGVEALYFAADDYTLFIDGTDNAVLAGDDAISASEDGTTVVAASVLLANDQEFDGDTTQIIGVSGTSVAGATVSLAAGSIVYDPGSRFDTLPGGATETDTFTYTVTDGNGGTDTATVTVTINGVNDDPVLTALSAVTIDENTASVPAGIGATDVDSTNLTFSISGTDADLFSIDAATGALNFLSPPDFEDPQDVGGDNTYDVTVTVEDGNGGNDSADIAVSVADVLEIPEVDARINEFHYDNAGGDVGEFVEIRTAAGDDVSALTIELYNGSSSQLNVYNSVSVAGLTMTTDGTYDYYVWEPSSIQNGSPDGIALSNGGTVIEFLSYEGTFTAVDGSAAGLTSTDIGQEEGSGTPIGDSLQRLADGTWDAPRAETKGAANDVAPTIVINEVLVSTTGSDVEFLEIFGTPGTSLAGLSIVNIESGDASGNIDNRFDLPADAEIGDNGFYLVGNSLVGSLGVTPNATIPGNFFENSSSTIALLETASISGSTVDGTETVIDAIALSDGDASETFYYGAQVLGPDGSFYPSAAGRFPDGGDWQLIDAFSPAGNNTTPTAGDGGGTGGPEEKLISEIQGDGAASALEGQQVIVEAIVVGDFQDGGLGANGDLNGFYLQEEDADADGDALTSEGIFVFDGFSPGTDVQVGDKVRITGTVTEFFGETQLSGLTDIQIVSGGNTLPTAAQITFPVAKVTTNSNGELIADLEAYEGMLVTLPQEMTVSDLFTLGRFGDIGLQQGGLLETFTQANAPSVAGFQAFQETAVKNAVLLDDGFTTQNPDTIPFEIDGEPGNIAGQFDAGDPLSAGDTVTGITGVLRYGTGSGSFGDEAYRINPTEAPVFVDDVPRDGTAPDVGGTIIVSSFNLLNFFTTIDDGTATSGPNSLQPRGADSLDEFLRQTDKLIAALAEVGADVFGLVELENEYGDQNGDGLFSLQYIVDALNSTIPGAAYDFVDPGVPYGDTGDAIMVGMIYNTNTVEIAAGTNPAILTDALLPSLGLNFGNPVFDGPGTSRAPLAATFTEISSGEEFTVAVNHFKSKGSISPFGNNAGIGDGTGNNNEARLQAAQALDAWLDTNPTGTSDPDTLIIGDLNAYAMEDPVTFLKSEGYVDQVEVFLPVDEFAFSFGFPVDLNTSPSVQSFGALDYGFASASLASQVTGAAEWHINALEASALDYNTEFKPQSQIDDLYAADGFRSSDHDPLVIGLDLGPPDTLLS